MAVTITELERATALTGDMLIAADGASATLAVSFAQLVEYIESRRITEFKYFYELSPPSGWAVRDGAILPDADVNYPALWQALHKPENAWKRKTLAEWEALSDAAEGVGGVPYFVLDTASKTIKLPDTRGDSVVNAGRGSVVGDWQDSQILRHIHRTEVQVGLGTANSIFSGGGAGAFGSGSNLYTGQVLNAASGDESHPRRFAALGCVYIGGN